MNNIEGVGYIQKSGKDPFPNKLDSYKKLANFDNEDVEFFHASFGSK